MKGFSFFGALGLSDTKVGAWLVALAALLTSLCDGGVFGPDGSHVICAVVKAVGASGFGVMVNGARNAMEPKA